jgi:hypothetical protein
MGLVLLLVMRFNPGGLLPEVTKRANGQKQELKEQ